MNLVAYSKLGDKTVYVRQEDICRYKTLTLLSRAKDALMEARSIKVAQKRGTVLVDRKIAKTDEKIRTILSQVKPRIVR